jgi:protoporphyrinogen oxidase
VKAVVIGGGVAGLAAAYELVRGGHDVSLYEAGPTLGGQVRTTEVGGGRIESFYHHIFRSDTEIVALIEELGLGDDLGWIVSKTGMHAAGRIYPFTTAVDLLRFSPVSLLTRLRLGLGALWLRTNPRWRDYEGMRASDWIRSRVGRQGYEHVWEPLLRAKFGEEAEDVSMVWFWGKIYLRFASRDGGPLGRERLGYLRGSFGRLVDALAAAIEAGGGRLAAGTPVEQIETREGRVTGVRFPDGSREGCDTVIATVPSPIFQRLLPNGRWLDPYYTQMLESVRYQWATVLMLELDRPLSAYYWLTMSEPDCPFVVAVEQTNLVPAERYGGRRVVYLSNYTDPGDPLVDQTAGEVLASYEPWLRRVNPDFDRSWVLAHHLFVDRAGQPIVHARYHETIAPHRTPVRGVFLANTTQIYPEDRGQNYSIRMGRRVARLAMAEDAGRGDGAARGAGDADGGL